MFNPCSNDDYQSYLLNKAINENKSQKVNLYESEDEGKFKKKGQENLGQGNFSNVDEVNRLVGKKDKYAEINEKNFRNQNFKEDVKEEIVSENVNNANTKYLNFDKFLAF